MGVIAKVKHFFRGETKPKRRPRVQCPICFRMVSVTKYGVTMRHQSRPGQYHVEYHAVRISDGKEFK